MKKEIINEMTDVAIKACEAFKLDENQKKELSKLYIGCLKEIKELNDTFQIISKLQLEGFVGGIISIPSKLIKLKKELLAKYPYCKIIDNNEDIIIFEA